MKFFKNFLTILSLLLLFACTGSKELSGIPSWISDPTNKYPDFRYLSAVGSGDTRQMAEDRATANIAKIFEVTVKVDDRSQTQYSSESDLQNYKNEFIKESYDQRTQIQTEQSLLNIKFSSTWTDKMGRIHLIAYLERNETADIYRENISKRNKSIGSYLDEVETIGDFLDRFSLIGDALALAEANRELIDQLKIIHPASYQGLKSSDRYDEIKLQKIEMAQTIQFYVRIKGDQENKIRPLIEEMISKEGYKISDNGLFKVEGAVKYENVDLDREDAVFVVWYLTISVSDPSDKVIYSLELSEREGGISYSAAKRKAVIQIEKVIKLKFNNFLMH